jgi:solute carrier family 66 (lysosomal lysine-arginine transporter), member 1
VNDVRTCDQLTAIITMFPPQQSIQIDLAALSGICGSISIACWVVVFSPQIIENFRRSSAEGLSITFIVIWLAGDVFNIIGGLLQGILPTMIILAIYYTLADIVLILQVFYYRGFTLTDTPTKPISSTGTANGHASQLNGDAERQPLLAPPTTSSIQRRSSSTPSSTFDGAHYSPATPIHDSQPADPATQALQNLKPRSTLHTMLLNTFAVLLVCAAGTFGWYLSQLSSASAHRRHRHDHHSHGKSPDYSFPAEYPEYDTWGQVFGYLCAAFYLGSRVPQIILNYRRKSTEGVSLLFFLFACIGNLTYDMSIFAYDPSVACTEGGEMGMCGEGEAGRIYRRYLAVNASWIVGSLGTLMLDMGIFGQFFWYRKEEDDEDTEAVEE